MADFSVVNGCSGKFALATAAIYVFWERHQQFAFSLRAVSELLFTFALCIYLLILFREFGFANRNTSFSEPDFWKFCDIRNRGLGRSRNIQFSVA